MPIKYLPRTPTTWGQKVSDNHCRQCSDDSITIADQAQALESIADKFEELCTALETIWVIAGEIVDIANGDEPNSGATLKRGAA